MTNCSRMGLKVKSNKFVPAAAMDGGGESETLGKEGGMKLVDLLDMDDEFENSPMELCSEDYEGGWGDEFYDAEFDKKLRG